MSKTINYSIVIPVYNGEHTVKNLHERIKKVFSKNNYEIIFVYDCGKDNSWEKLEKIKTQDPEHVKLIKLSRNYGQHNALICGFEHANGDFIITMDEDLQHFPEDIELLVKEQILNDYDVVYGKYDTRMHSGIRNFSSSLLKKIIEIGIPEIHPDYSAFRMIKSKVAKSCIGMQNSYTFLDGYLSWITTHCSSCIVRHSERQGGESAYNFNKLVNHSINIFVTFSNLPIRFLSKFSIILLFIISLYSFYIIIRKIIYNDFAMGYPTIVILFGFGIGLIMLSLGILGEYVYRINLKTTKRPNYNIDKII